MTSLVYKLNVSSLAQSDISTAFSTYTLPTEYAIFQNGATNMAFLSAYPKFIATDTTGARMSGALLYTYIAGGSTPTATYTDAGAGTANANPVVCDANGEADVWLDPANLYKMVLKSSAGVTQWTVDNVGGPSTYGQTAFATTLLAASTAAASRLVLGFPAIAGKGVLIAGTAANTLGALAAGTDGQYLVAQSSQTAGVQWSTVAGATSKNLLNITSYASAGTFTYNPATTTVGSIVVYSVGSGGGGAIGNASGGGGGGGAGGTAIKRLTTSQTGTSQTITVPAGGASATAGTSASLGALCVATGGQAGTPYASTPTTGGVGTVGDVIIQGGAGAAGIGVSAGASGGVGGGSHFGGGGAPGTASSAAGSAGGTPGGGGGGGYVSGAGGAGAAGAVIIYEYAI